MKRVLLNKMDALSILLCVAAIIPGLLIYSSLPEMIPTHFGMYGEPDKYSSRTFTVFGIPLIMACIQTALCVVTNIFWKEKRNGRGEMVIRLLVPVSLYAGLTFMLLYALRKLDSILPFVGVMESVSLLILGNYMPKVRRNMIAGIRTPHTLASPEIWDKTHRFAGILYVAGGIVCMAVTLTGAEPLYLTCIVIAVFLVPLVYSEILYRRYKEDIKDIRINEDQCYESSDR